MDVVGKSMAELFTSHVYSQLPPFSVTDTGQKVDPSMDSLSPTLIFTGNVDEISTLGEVEATVVTMTSALATRFAVPKTSTLN